VTLVLTRTDARQPELSCDGAAEWLSSMLNT
jgi:hypothetical protein